MTIAVHLSASVRRAGSRRGGGLTSDQRIAAVLDVAMADIGQPQDLLDRIVSTGIADGLEWHEIVSAVDEAERRTGLSLHPANARQ